MFLITKALAATIDVSIPCISCKYATTTSPVGVIANFYELAIALSGVLALGMIIYAGILRITGASNPKNVSESNDIMYNSLLGIVLLFGAYVLLNTINPQLTQLEIPALSKINVATSTTAGPVCSPDTFGSCAIATQGCRMGGDGKYSCVGGCSGDTMGVCPIATNECRKGEDGKYGCFVKDDLILGCRGEHIIGDGPETEMKWVSCSPRVNADGSLRDRGACDRSCVASLSTGDKEGVWMDNPNAKCETIDKNVCLKDIKQ